MTGALIGQETESGFARGAAVGAISGAVFAIEVFESSLTLWHSEESGLHCVLYLVSNFAKLFTRPSIVFISFMHCGLVVVILLYPKLKLMSFWKL